MATTTNNSKIPSRETLDNTRDRIFKFLRAIGTDTEIRKLLGGRGYTEDDHNEGWKLALRVNGYDAPFALHDDDTSVDDAISELDAWDEGGFRIARAALERLHPEQAEFVFYNLNAAQGPQAVGSVSKFLDRLDALEDSPDRKATRKQDRAALDTLAKRGIDVEERIRLRKLVKAAQGFLGLPADDPRAAKKDAANLDDLVALHRWFRDWSETARVALPRRDQHIKLGIAARRASGGETGEEVEETEEQQPES